MKKTKLIIDHDYDFDLIGMISSVKFYKLAWSIGRALRIKLVKAADHEIEFKMSKPSHFCKYEHVTDAVVFQMFQNKSEGKEKVYLLPEMPHLDYIVKIDSSLQSFATEELIKQLREVKWIEYIAAIDKNKLKSKDNFLD